jgi:ribosomal protein S18 acetylase RimI-like enzyme
MARGHRIERLEPVHVDELQEVWTEAALAVRPTGRDSTEAIRGQMRLPNCRFLGARDPSGRLVGAAIATHEGRKGWINRIAVRPSHRRRGVAGALVAACESWLFGEGILIVAALVEGNNAPSQALFDASGYQRDETLVYFRKLSRPDA